MVRMIPQITAISLTLILLGGCATRLAYNNLDYWVGYNLSNYVSLDSRLESSLDGGLARALERHRGQELPKLHRALDQLVVDLSIPLTFSQVRGYYHTFNNLGKSSIAVLAEPLADMLSGLTEQQVAELDRKITTRLNEINQERAGLAPGQKLAKRTERLEDFTQDWIGSLTSKQEAMLQELAGYQLEMEPVFLAIRSYYLDSWRALMQQRNSPNFESQLSQLLQKIVSLETPHHQAEVNFYLNRRFELMRRLNHTLSDKQRGYLISKLTGLRKDVAVLINQ
ncbi:hypothetical protein C9I98_04060 [Photobacterium sanctipauli]|uniref:Uncharacterized protein n=3 Tax=Photobacterium sanctipauli TaxID=1342794 RepID=A0A2T3NXU8_9GAMM|nr:hypothetical protein C9I98_04060 [Photobacterium sanctipauli]